MLPQWWLLQPFSRYGVYSNEGTQDQWLGVSNLSFQKILSFLLGATLNHLKKSKVRFVM